MTDKEYVLQLINNELDYWTEIDDEGGTLCAALHRAKRFIQDTKTSDQYQEKFERAEARSTALVKDIENLTAIIEMLEQRLKHLLSSEFIRSFDEKSVTGEYKRNIADADKIALRKNLEFHYEHLDERLILTGEDARAFTKAFIDYLERR